MSDEAPERWVTDGKRVRRGGTSGPVVCTMGDPAQGSLFEEFAHEWQDAELIVRAPQLVAALEECAKRLETCCHFSGTAAEYAVLAVKEYRDLIAAARGKRAHP